MQFLPIHQTDSKKHLYGGVCFLISHYNNVSDKNTSPVSSFYYPPILNGKSHFYHENMLCRSTSFDQLDMQVRNYHKKHNQPCKQHLKRPLT